MKPRDALADDVQIGGPQALVLRLGESRRGQIIDQRVEPDVHRLLGIPGEGNPPRQSLAGNGDVLQAVLEQAHDLVATDRGLHAKLVGRDELQQALAVGAEPEEVIAFPRRNQLECGVLDAAAVLDLRRLLELLASGAVEPFVVGDV
jgi:hypothetical protein